MYKPELGERRGIKILAMYKFLFFALLVVLFAYGCGKENTNDEAKKEDPIEEQTGTIEHPYLIKNKQDLFQMRTNVNTDNANYGNKVYKLMADIDLTGEPNWIPIGNSHNVAFMGIFDGNNKVIKNIRIGSNETVVSMTYAGLFGYASGSDIKNLGIQWSRLNSSSYSGGIVGFITGSKITNCYTTGDISGSGIADKATACSISDCYSTCAINSGSGIADEANSSYIKGCYSTGNINLGSGIANSASLIINCYSTGNISEGNGVGGGSGIGNAGAIINCYSTGNVYSIGHAAGIAPSGSKILNCYSSGDISTSHISIYSYSNYSFAGGIVSEVRSGNLIQYCLALNKSIKSINPTGYAYVNRIGCVDDGSIVDLSSNYASSTIVVKKGTSEATLTTITNFLNSKIHGSNLTGNPVDLLNKYVTANPTYEGITLLKWKVQAGVNNGLPVFVK